MTIKLTNSSIYSDQGEKKPEEYSHPHSTPQRIPMGSHILEHRQP